MRRRHLAGWSGSFHWNLKDSIELIEKTEKKDSCFGQRKERKRWEVGWWMAIGEYC